MEKNADAEWSSHAEFMPTDTKLQKAKINSLFTLLLPCVPISLRITKRRQWFKKKNLLGSFVVACFVDLCIASLFFHLQLFVDKAGNFTNCAQYWGSWPNLQFRLFRTVCRLFENYPSIMCSKPLKKNVDVCLPSNYLWKTRLVP